MNVDSAAWTNVRVVKSVSPVTRVEWCSAFPWFSHLRGGQRESLKETGERWCTLATRIIMHERIKSREKRKARILLCNIIMWQDNYSCWGNLLTCGGRWHTVPCMVTDGRCDLYLLTLWVWANIYSVLTSNLRCEADEISSTWIVPSYYIVQWSFLRSPSFPQWKRLRFHLMSLSFVVHLNPTFTS